jgi:hypothetical protein
MADNPPPYEEMYSGGHKVEDKKAANRSSNLSDQARATRSMLVSAAADKIHAALEQRALYGISRTRLVVIPAGHGCSEFTTARGKHATLLTVIDLSGPYEIVDFDEKPMVMELTGELNSVEFWSQAQATIELRQQVASRIGGGRGSMLEVRPGQLHVRYETPFGLFDTMNVMAIVVEIR